MTNQPNGTLYTGMTGDLVKRVYEHKGHFVKSFTTKYKLDLLVYYELHATSEDAAFAENA